MLRSLARLRPPSLRLAPGRRNVTTMAGLGGIVTDASKISAIARDCARVAVVGIRPKTDARGRDLSDRPAFFVPAALADDGVAIVPVPVPAAEVDEYCGAPPVTLSDLATLPPVDVAVFFRRPADLPPAAEVVAARPRVAWLQSGIRNPAWEAEVAAGGVQVVADRCMKVERARAKL